MPTGFQSYLTGIEITLNTREQIDATRFQSYLTGIEIERKQLGKERDGKFQSYLTGIEIIKNVFYLVEDLCSNRTLLELK